MILYYYRRRCHQRTKRKVLIFSLSLFLKPLVTHEVLHERRQKLLITHESYANGNRDEKDECIYKRLKTSPIFLLYTFNAFD